MHAEIERYLKETNAAMRPICEKLREIVLKAAPHLEEGIRWGGPSYKGKGVVCGIGAFQKHVNLFFFRGAQVPDPGGVFNHGLDNATSRNVQFFSMEDVKVKPLTTLVKAAAKVDAEGGAKARTKRPDLPVPVVLAEALRGDPRAKKFFDSLSPSARRDYCEWIGSAKQEVTMQRRLEKAMTRLGEGRKLGDEYV
ncbi:uncharacterized protein YdeI (YjbR/CyaY-like superfamily) [Roseimicrobium gellanilyticum]|uniref:Uncharacterized protein YdeI (YjbR/CyaY-like superfamily) n=1 Tax=Roseimicrobium gellanilyticum TaxID=748857 RepID=A0A366HMR5_9BACT|nr:YdeI/OmpD-associated family protein [Roseimicrobium gellanilyticum]RBP44437.1 uncharacterized protein YdeI (YjbR/CyaY-like superfamily) [Roseimicrobium gellanilyticum]